ncbi:bifunctional glutamate N-acetyltransferase/amino-acid acetyltransferase ArgJ [Opitutales bacterium ASA1]|uniref:bifunctional ornithine acetyltransferase/N-acetylglutamate synthase n=1 Tax=Congregicoccus parvus TaxID=3081749 RepID=UPI002B28593A|nr:bifunctional glutamate N-acetyltransferase/amino-acid acetyltransferase ArgJ [Opitutales bacterium ASA1]
MSHSDQVFGHRDEHRAWLASQAALPAGFRVGSRRFAFTPREVHKPAQMTLTVIALDEPTPDFAAMFTRNAFPGAPVKIGHRRLDEETLGAIVVNNKISNVCAPDGEAASEAVCEAAARALGLRREQVLPSSTGVIGWSLPVDAMTAAMPDAAAALAGDSILPAAEGIVTTDLYPKIRRVQVGAGSIVAIAKGAGMIEPNMATMLVFILTDLSVPRVSLREVLGRVVDRTFNCISVDSDTSTSDTVVALSSGRVACDDLEAFEAGLLSVCAALAEDVVRNGEGVRHVMRVRVCGAPDAAIARALGKAIVNAPLFKCAVAGNDPNVGRLVQAIGKHVGAHASELDLSRTALRMGGVEIFRDGVFRLDPEKERLLQEHLRGAELYVSAPGPDGVFTAPVDYPPHGRCVEIDVQLGSGTGEAVVFGADLTHEYVSENADYRS